MAPNNYDEDWIKTRVWDVRDPYTHEPVTTLEGLCPGGMLNRVVILGWTQLPCWKAAPASLKANAEEYLKEYNPNAH
jgi:hypothetical protein